MRRHNVQDKISKNNIQMLLIKEKKKKQEGKGTRIVRVLNFGQTLLLSKGLKKLMSKPCGRTAFQEEGRARAKALGWKRA